MWFLLYVLTPFVVPYLWFRNRVTDPKTPDADDVIVPKTLRQLTGAIGVGIVFVAVFMFLFPKTLSTSGPGR